MENYIMLEGEKIPLTDEQIKMLKDSKKLEEVKKNPFERVRNKGYYFIQYNGTVEYDFDRDSSGDICCFAIANYCTDKELMKQRALHEILNRLLWRFSMENGGGESTWGIYDRDCNYYITYNYDMHPARFTVEFTLFYEVNGTVYFSSKELAERAIEEIIKPFMKDHPEFVW